MKACQKIMNGNHDIMQHERVPHHSIMWHKDELTKLLNIKRRFPCLKLFDTTKHQWNIVSFIGNVKVLFTRPVKSLEMLKDSRSRFERYKFPYRMYGNSIVFHGPISPSIYHQRNMILQWHITGVTFWYAAWYP